MAYRVPGDEDVVTALRSVFRSTKTVVSQRELGRRVQDALRKADDAFSVTAERVRRLAAVQPFVRLEVRTRKGPKEKILHRCPVCGTPLERLKNQTLFGGEVTLVLRCPTCRYSTGKEKRIPTLYVFHNPGKVEQTTAPEQPF
ncbi:MAG TPA: hypothetical protein VI818_08375 [Candidatus Thermoplasmatota archaeon]|nr:hypothetical protein [Candidatus Thermoplasmatota archaeon]